MDALHYLIVLVSIPLILYQFTLPKRNKRKHQIPRPPTLPIVGHFYFLTMLLKLPMYDVLNNLCYKYGPLFLLRLGSRPTLVLSIRSDVEECFANNDIIFSNRPNMPSREIMEYNYTTLGAPYGNHWRNLRRFFAVEIFSPRSLQMSSKFRTEEIGLTTKHLFKSSFQGNWEVDLKSFLYKLDFNIIMRMVTGKRCFEEDELMDTEIAKRKLDDLKHSFNPVEPVALGDYVPFLRWLTWYGAEKKIRNKHIKRDAFLQALLDAHENPSKYPSVRGVDVSQTIIGVMLKLQESEPEFYTDNVIKGTMMAMLLAGTHTTVITMEAAISRLMSHSEVFKKARDEIDNLVGQSRLLNDDDLPKLEYLHCIINETLRLDVVTILPTRVSSEDCTVRGYHIARGTQLLVNIWALHRDPELWIEPKRFMPERFQQSEEEKRGYNYKYVPFGLGRRICPGSSLATRVMALSLGTLIQCFDWEEAEKDNQGPGKTNLNKREKSIKMIFRPREALRQVLAQL